MQFEEYRHALAALQFGKRLPTAIYVFKDSTTDLGQGLNDLLRTLKTQFELGDEFNVIKFRTDELKLSFLRYPGFLEEAHPALSHAVTIDLVSGRVRRTDYRDNHNPPILHRKESFLPEQHPNRKAFEDLTQAEEAVGLYAQPQTIGFKLNWELLLGKLGLKIDGHRLEKLGTREPNCIRNGTPQDCQIAVDNSEGLVAIERHKTAMRRYDLSKPVKSLLQYGILKQSTTFFDYGCGQGSDVRGLQALGHAANGWDPVHRPDVSKCEADVVNMGYVLNVIENPAERIEALVDAYRYAQRLLVVSALIQETVETKNSLQYRDGVLTRRKTFQKFFEQQELQQYIEDTLECTAVPISLGVFYVFRDPIEQQDFLSARGRRAIDWSQISARLGLGEPRTMWKRLYEQHRELLDGFGVLAMELGRFPLAAEFDRISQVEEHLGSLRRGLRAFVQGRETNALKWEEVRVRFGIGQLKRKIWETLYDENRELLDDFWSVMLRLGRLPEPEEFARFSELREKIGSPKKALRIFIQKGGEGEMQRATDERKGDLLVYVALANLRKRVPFGHLSQSLRFDIREFFGNYTAALEKGVELLYAAGDPGEIEVACEELKIGWQDEQALYFHRSLLVELPPILRAYVGCATALFGDVAQTDLVKLHKSSGKVTFLGYDDFDGKDLPQLRNRIKVNLRTRWVQVFDHSPDGQLLYFKERFLSPSHPKVVEMEAFSATLRALGITEQFTPPLKELLELIERHDLNTSFK